MELILFDDFLQLLESSGGDYTNCFRCLSLVSLTGSSETVVDQLVSNFSSCERMQNKLKYFLDENGLNLLFNREIEDLMSLYESQPDILQDMKKNQKILQEIREMTPGSKSKNDKIKCTKWMKEYVKRLHVDARGFANVKTYNKKRFDLMNSTNPKFVLRNYLAQNAIHSAENGDYSEVKNLLKIVENPFSDEIDNTIEISGFSLLNTPTSSKSTNPKYDDLPPDWADDLKVT
uniref:Uncharacterized protein n=1 Tax=Strigamia maritima TaxID=126957 RepID=T1JL60_STRMM